MSDEEKRPYNEKAAEDKERYLKQKSEYDESNPTPQTATEPKKNKKVKTGPTKPKTAYQYFCNDKRVHYKELNPTAAPSEMMKILADAWRNATDDDKKEYEEKAEKDKERYDAEMVEEKYIIIYYLERKIHHQNLEQLILYFQQKIEILLKEINQVYH